MSPNHHGERAVEAPTTVDPVDIALRRAHDSPVSPDVMRFLRKQERLVEAQTAQVGRERWRHISIMFIGACVLGAFGLMMWDASRARGVAIEPFRVPSEMTARGLDGVVVATQVVDQLLRMQDATESLRAPWTYNNNWGDDISVEIPNTGITIGDLRASLRAWLGKQVRLTGEVVRRLDGTLELNVRVGASAGRRFAAPESEFDSLIERAAEAVYEQTQPYRYTIWLRTSGRNDEAQERIRELAYGSNREDRLWALNSMAARAGDAKRAISILEQGLRIDPNFTPFLYNLSVNHNALGHEQETWTYAKRFLALKHLAREQISRSRYPALVREQETIVAQLEMELAKGCQIAAKETDAILDRTWRMIRPINVATCHTLARDVPAAENALVDAGVDDEARAALVALAPDLEIESSIAEALDDWETMYAILNAVREKMPAQPADPLMTDPSFALNSRIALAAAWTGRIEDARQAIATTPLDCAFCVRTRGTIEALAGDASEMNRWFDSAQRLTEKLPTVYGERARALLILKDWPAAIEQAQIASRIAPRWAEPKKYWGDALAERQDFDAALVKYREAEKHAPNWGALKIAMGNAYAASGQTQLAREKWEQAAQLPLSPGDRSAVERLLRD